MMKTTIRETRSVCPVCLKNLPAVLTRRDNGQIWLEKTCPDHGFVEVPVWQGRMDFDRWLLETQPLPEGCGLSCPQNCGICPEHEIGTCCTLLEVTRRCNLRCRYCFADGGTGEDLPIEECKAAIRDIVRQCGQPLLCEKVTAKRTVLLTGPMRIISLCGSFFSTFCYFIRVKRAWHTGRGLRIEFFNISFIKSGAELKYNICT